MRYFFSRAMVFALALLVSYSLLKPGMFKTHDYVHAARISEMGRALIDYHFPPRWSQNFGYGYGMPLFSFYAPLPYFVGSIFWLGGLDVTTSIKLLYFISTWVIGLGSWKLVSNRWGKRAGLVAAALIMFAPYRAVNMFVRGAMSELWGMMALPWILFQIDRIFQGKSDAWWKLALWVTVLLLSHNLTALISLPAIATWIVINLISSDFRLTDKSFLHRLGKVIVGGFLGLGLASFYVWPAILEKGYTQMDKLILGGYFDFNLHFLYLRQFFNARFAYGGSSWGPNDDISFYLGFAQILGLLLGGYWLIKKIGQRKFDQQLQTGLLLASMIIGLLLMSTLKAQPIWQALPFLSYIQFPWRMLAVATTLVGLFCAWVVSIQPKIRGFFLALILLLFSLGNLKFFRPQDNQDYTAAFYYTDASIIQSEMSGILPDFMPATFHNESVKPIGQLLYYPDDLRDLAEVIVNKTHQKLLNINLRNPATLTFSVADFPGWQVEVNGQVMGHETSSEGLIQLSLPAGNQQIGLIWTETPARFWSNAVSLTAVFILMLQIPIWKENHEHSS